MSALTLAVPANYPLVGVGLFGCFALNLFQMHKVTLARKTANVSYPTLYVSEADANADPKKKTYNCIQRAHQNTLENVSFILALNLFLGLFKPVAATALTLTWVLGRFGYTLGYSTGIPKNRNAGVVAKLQYIGTFGLLFTSTYVAAKHAYGLYF